MCSSYICRCLHFPTKLWRNQLVLVTFCTHTFLHLHSDIKQKMLLSFDRFSGGKFRITIYKPSSLWTDVCLPRSFVVSKASVKRCSCKDFGNVEKSGCVFEVSNFPTRLFLHRIVKQFSNCVVFQHSCQQYFPLNVLKSVFNQNCF